MSDEAAPVAGPRRYRVSFNCRADAVGAVIGLLIREVESPKMETIGEHYKLTLICMHDQLRTVLDLVVDDADCLVIAPHVPEMKMAPAVYKPPQQLAKVVTPLQRDVQVIRPRLTRVKGNKCRHTQSGSALLKAFDDGARVKHAPDFSEALVAAGFNGNSWSPTAARLVEEGDLVRIGRGAYRLPTAHEAQDFSSSDE